MTEDRGELLRLSAFVSDPPSPMTSPALDRLEFNLPGTVLVDMKNTMGNGLSLESGKIGTNELASSSGKWRFE